MTRQELGEWAPLSVAAAVELFRAARFRWWLAGGNALQVHVGRAWREHSDLDIGIRRRDTQALFAFLEGWEIYAAADGTLTLWEGDRLDDRSDRGPNNLWCRRSSDGPWQLDILVSDGDDHDWVFRRDESLRRSWPDAILTTEDNVPYLAPDIQLLFKSKHPRPKDHVDASTIIPELRPHQRSWLAMQLASDHPWQETIARERAQQVALMSVGASEVEPLAVGKCSFAWTATDGSQRWAIRVPIPNSGRLLSYRCEQLIAERLVDAGHPVSSWQLHQVDGVECSIGRMLDGSPVDYDTVWGHTFLVKFADLLRDLHSLPTQGWGPLENRADRLQGSTSTATQGIIERWFHAAIWPFDSSDLADHWLMSLDPDVAAEIAPRADSILKAAGEPFGVVHSDLHHEHLLEVDGDLSGILDFGDAFVGSTAWDFALVHWYYGAENAHQLALRYGSAADDLSQRAALLALAVGCYKVAKSPDSATPLRRLRQLLDHLGHQRRGVLSGSHMIHHVAWHR